MVVSTFLSKMYNVGGMFLLLGTLLIRSTNVELYISRELVLNKYAHAKVMNFLFIFVISHKSVINQKYCDKVKDS